MSTITKQWLQQKIADMEAIRDDIPFGLGEDGTNTLAALRIALASLEAEAVCVIDQSNLDYLKSGSDADVWPASRAEMGDVLLYRSATPAAVSVPDGVLKSLLPDAEKPEFWFEHNGKIFFEGVKFNNAVFEACRAAMLQGADVSLTHEGKNHHEDKLGMVNHLGDVTEKVEPVTQIEPVADLYGLTSPTGGETSFTFDAVEARDFIDGGWSCQEYVELERFQEAVSGNSPVIQDGWVMVPVEPTEDMIVNGFESEPDESFSDEKEWEAYEAMSGCQQAAHRAKLCWAAMIAAAPKLE
ncbi:hypothetical protein [Enterobacter asburiae]|uniref:Uncharacterized protein n=1 Tax=Enterobacter asburiae TaxID=61645 RepID=A0AAW7ZTZ5_ENTAS|nr:hypothetical protein [Enterobacter asburiae]MDO7923021.1 hypothetical protein [Enterobacter asburiae]UOY54789.1 hypothetical protein LCD48_15165 [Enterobacter asburiae]